MMTRNVYSALALAATFAAGAWAGHAMTARADRGGASGGPTVATYSGGRVDAATVRAALAREPAATRSGHPEVAKRIVDDLVRTRILASLASEKGYDRDPEIAQRQAELLASAYLEKEFDAPERARPPTDDEVRAWFEAHRAEFERPERVRVAVIAFPAVTPAERDAKRGRATAALAEAKRREKDYYAFGELARRRSEDPKTAARQGELPIMSREELTAAVGLELATAAFEVPEPGKVHPAVVEGASGLYVLKLLGRETARNPTFEELRDTIRARLAAERLSERRKAFLERAWNEAHVHVDEAALREAVEGARAARR
jgi:peptidyl-prolyl cis-trans isomerase C